MKSIVLIKSCWPHKTRRDACRDTWLRKLDWAPHVFVMGAHPPKKLYGDPCENLYGETDIKAYRCLDDYKNIGLKLQQAFIDAAPYHSVVVLDDDTYVVPVRLKELVDTVQPNDYVGFLRPEAGCWGTFGYMQGSAYILGYALVQRLAFAFSLTKKMPDDVAVGEALNGASVNYRHEPRFHPGPAPVLDLTNLITTHKVNPQGMHWLQENNNAL